MAQRKSVRGPRSSVLWLAIIVVLLLAIALAVVVFVIGPERERQQQVAMQSAQATLDAQVAAAQTKATAEAKAAEIKRAYDAGIAFAAAGDWVKAAEEFAKVVTLEPGYKDAAARLAEARTSAVESAYQRGLAYFDLGRWEQAKAEFEQVIVVDPNYKDVQAKLAEVEVKLAETRALPPTVTSTATPKPTLPSSPTATNTPSIPPISLVTNGDFESPDAGSWFVVYKARQTFDSWTVESGSVDLTGRLWPAARGKQSVDLTGTTDEAGTIYQNLPTVPGQSYVLRFAKGGNPGGEPAIKRMEVWWDDNLVDTLTVDTTGWKVNTIVWEYREYTVVALGSTTRLRFKSLTEGNFGPVLDDVSVVPKSR